MRFSFNFCLSLSLFLSLSPSPFFLSVIPQLIGDSTVDATVMAENDITIYCSINGTGLKYTWLRQDSRPLPLSALITDDVLTLINVSYATAGVYTCTGSNIAGNTSQYHNITVEGERRGEGGIQRKGVWEKEVI